HVVGWLVQKNQVRWTAEASPHMEELKLSPTQPVQSNPEQWNKRVRRRPTMGRRQLQILTARHRHLGQPRWSLLLNGHADAFATDDFPRKHAGDADDGVENGCLSTAIRTDEADDFACRDAQVHWTHDGRVVSGHERFNGEHSF
ncbi:MAG TPA: hypothetical protein VIB47_07300, partial [Dehalococcoidia bacterium]